MSMKTKLLLLISAVFICSQMVFAQSVEKQIVAIRAEVAAINKNEKSYTKTTKDVEGISLEGTEATYFSSTKGLRKITAKMYGETFQATGEYYFQGEDLIFAYEKLSLYDTQIGLSKPVKVIRVEEKRFYFSGGKMIRYLLGKKNINSEMVEFTDAQNSTIETADKLRKAFSE